MITAGRHNREKKTPKYKDYNFPRWRFMTLGKQAERETWKLAIARGRVKMAAQQGSQGSTGSTRAFAQKLNK